MYEFNLRPLFLAAVLLGVGLGLLIAFPGVWIVSYLYNHIQWVP